MVFPVTVFSIVVNISSQSKHIEGKGVGEAVLLSSNILYLTTDNLDAAKAFCFNFHNLTCSTVFSFTTSFNLMNPVHHVSFFLTPRCFFIEKHLSTS